MKVLKPIACLVSLVSLGAAGACAYYVRANRKNKGSDDEPVTVLGGYVFKGYKISESDVYSIADVLDRFNIGESVVIEKLYMQPAGEDSIRDILLPHTINIDFPSAVYRADTDDRIYFVYIDKLGYRHGVCFDDAYTYLESR